MGPCQEGKWTHKILILLEMFSEVMLLKPMDILFIDFQNWCLQATAEHCRFKLIGFHDNIEFSPKNSLQMMLVYDLLKF